MVVEFYNSWITTIVAWTEANLVLALVLVFIFAFAESVVLIAVVVPSTLIFAGIGAVYASAGEMLFLLWLAGSLGAIGGDAFSFSLGRILKDDLHTRWPFRDYPHVLAQSRNVFHEWGWFALIAGKFAFGIRPFVPLTAGMLAMPVRTFFLASSVSGVLWAGVMLGAGFVVARAFSTFFSVSPITL